LAAFDALEDIVSTLGDMTRRDIQGGVIDLDAMKSQHVERPVRQRPDGLLRDTSTARLGNTQ
jgi:hypothetical protein